jgi:catechol 2,3-dioxygenase-like lactoylglutathione lyase family enzyme
MISSTYCVKIHSHSADALVSFLTDTLGMKVQHEFVVTGESLQEAFGWPPDDDARGWMLGEGDRGLVEVFDVPLALRETVRDGLAMLSFIVDDLESTMERVRPSASNGVWEADSGVPGVEAALCEVLNVPLEFLTFSDELRLALREA